MIYQNIKRIADDQHISIRQIEQRAGLSNGTIGKWREVQSPNVIAVKRVAEVLGVQIAEILEGAT